MTDAARPIAIDSEHVRPRLELRVANLAFSDLLKSVANLQGASRLTLPHSEPVA